MQQVSPRITKQSASCKMQRSKSRQRKSATNWSASHQHQNKDKMSISRPVSFQLFSPFWHFVGDFFCFDFILNTRGAQSMQQRSILLLFCAQTRNSTTIRRGYEKCSQFKKMRSQNTNKRAKRLLNRISI